jgi:hypothetical protein
MDNITHKEIYDRLIQVEGKVDSLDTKTEEVVKRLVLPRVRS